MNSESSLHTDLIAPGPSRDLRFTVNDCWNECVNFPRGHPEETLQFLHRQMNEEVDSLECSARNLSDFPEAHWELRMCLARQCADEARHSWMFRRLFEKRGGQLGQYPVLNFQYRIITHFDNLPARLAIQNRSFEAGGIDAITFGVGQARDENDFELAELYESQCADEISHVRFANDWIRRLCDEEPKNLMRIALAMQTASKAFVQVMGREGIEGVNYPADRQGRLEAGFTTEEIETTVNLANGKT